jgi:hypothetical protein
MRLVLAFFLMFLPSLAHAQMSLDESREIAKWGQLLSPDDVKEHFSGKTHEGFYSRKRIRSGSQDYEETYHEDGKLTYKEGEWEDVGEWWLSEGRLCHAYAKDTFGNTHCFFIYKDQQCFVHVAAEPGAFGKMRIATNWNARSLIRGTGKYCDAAVS